MKTIFTLLLFFITASCHAQHTDISLQGFGYEETNHDDIEVWITESEPGITTMGSLEVMTFYIPGFGSVWTKVEDVEVPTGTTSVTCRFDASNPPYNNGGLYFFRFKENGSPPVYSDTLTVDPE